jgi:hypothetical protein
MSSTADHLIVYVDFGVGFLDQRQPPSAIDGRFGKSRLMRVNWEKVINSDVLGATFYESTDGEYTFVSILLLSKHVRDKVSSLG